MSRRQFLQSTTLAAATALTRMNTAGRPSSARQRLLNRWDGDWSETYICNLSDWYLKVQETMPWLTSSAFLNGASCGLKKRNSQDFAAAGWRWLAKFTSGESHLRVAARKNGSTVTDEIRFRYQTERWEEPVRLELREIARKGNRVAIQARLGDAKGVLCLDSRKLVRFGLTGDGSLLNDLGTSTGSRVVELNNGRVEISLFLNGGASVASVSAKGIPTAFLTVT